MSSSPGPWTTQSPTTAIPANGTTGEATQAAAHFDLSLVVIWLIAVVTLVVGSYWSGKVRHSLFLLNKRSVEEGRAEDEDDDETSGRKKKKKAVAEEEQFLNISPVYVLFFVCCMAGMLLALYYFFNYLVYVIIALFVLASILSSFVCLSPIAKHLLPQSLVAARVPCGSDPVPVYQAVVLFFSVCLSITWLIFRKKSFGWVLQDTLGVFFSINMLRTIRLPSFRICTILLSLLFLYDIFFVFLTPLITPSGKSVMVEVATGGSQDDGAGPGDGSGTPRETLPMVLTVPHLSWPQSNASAPSLRPVRSYSLLGFGDILVPGLLVSYCHAFDLIHAIPFRPYFVASSVAYAVGLVITFVGLFLMSGMPQPALLYLVPCTLIPPILISYFRSEFRELWHGPGDGTAGQPHKSSKSGAKLFRDEQVVPSDVTDSLPTTAPI